MNALNEIIKWCNIFKNGGLMTMGVFILDMKHLPDMCPMFNEEVREHFNEQSHKMGDIAAELDIKILHIGLQPNL